MKPVLPIDDSLPEILRLAQEHSSLVVSASPGAGKTTRLPPALLQITKKAVWVLEPRRIAALSASERIAEEKGWKTGAEVGYQVRFENRSGPGTRLLFLTEALLLRKLLNDPELGQVGCVVLDEFHERSLHIDLAIGALKELQELSRPDLKIIVMSATLNAAPLQAFLNCPLVEVPGRIFPQEIRYETRSQLLQTGPEFTDRMAALVRKAAMETRDGGILCFLPGRGEIERLKSALAPWANGQGFSLFPLHGQLNLEEQRQALSPARGRRKIILATNVAESSLTVEGVSVVVDSGLARISQLHPRTGYESLDLVRISKASATQRAGRSARTGPGTVYRAWMPYDELSMKEFELPEVQRTDLSESILLLAALGVSRPESFSWFEAPPVKALEQARDFLLAVGALNEDGSLTEEGNRIRELPLHPRLAELLLRGKEAGLSSLACELAALLSEGGGRVPAFPGAENDLWLKREDWKRNPARYRNVGRAAEQLKSLIRAGGESLRPKEEDVARLLLGSYKDRLCRRRRAHEPQAKMAGGRGVRLHQDSSVRQSEYFLAVEIAEGRDAAEAIVYQAVGVPWELVEREILPLASPAKRPEWDEEKKRFFVVESREWRGLSLGREHRRPAEPSEIEGALTELAWKRWDQLLAADRELASLFSRLKALEKLASGWEAPGEEMIRQALEMACYGETSLESVQKKGVAPFVEQLLPEEQRQALYRECPISWTVPSGSRIRIQYTEDQGPQVEVRLQELFGLSAQPVVAGTSVTLVLLAPNFRPVQVTKDLASFWKNAYPEVRKEMRARYPKHSWPEDPLTAAPQAKGRARGSI